MGVCGTPGCCSGQWGVHSGKVANILEIWYNPPPLFALHPICLGSVASHRKIVFAICVTSNYSLSIILQASGSYVVIDRGQFRCRLASFFFFFRCRGRGGGAAAPAVRCECFLILRCWQKWMD